MRKIYYHPAKHRIPFWLCILISDSPFNFFRSLGLFLFWIWDFFSAWYQTNLYFQPPKLSIEHSIISIILYCTVITCALNVLSGKLMAAGELRQLGHLNGLAEIDNVRAASPIELSSDASENWVALSGCRATFHATSFLFEACRTYNSPKLTLVE